MKTRWMPLVGVTAAGMLAGVIGDLLRADPGLSPRDVLWGVVFSPFIVTGGGAAVAPPALSSLFLIGGCAFWPIYLLLVVLWIRSGKGGFLVALFLWTAQGFFQIGHRMMVMSGV